MFVKGFGKGRGMSRGQSMLRVDPELKVWLGNLAEGTKWPELQAHMNQAGKTKWVEVFTGRAKGTGAVVYTTAEEAANAIATLNGSELGGAEIEVDVWVKAPKDPGAAAGALVKRYYHAIAEHSASKMLECVSDDVRVFFAEDGERNWATKSVAQEKFTAWFEQSPDVSVTYEVKSVEQLKGAPPDGAPEDAEGPEATEVVLSADFGSGARGMRYVVNSSCLISEIEHQ